MVAVTRGVPAWLYHLRGRAGRWTGGGQEGGGKGGMAGGIAQRSLSIYQSGQAACVKQQLQL